MSNTLPQGFRTAGVSCGIKSAEDTLDLALFESAEACVAAGVFTQNVVCGAPVKVSRSRVPSRSVRAIVINSGNANACTGERGDDDARRMTSLVADELGCSEADVLVCSTGVIGHFLPMEKISTGITRVAKELDQTPESFLAAARGMMTTDTFPKQAKREVVLAGRTVRVSGAAKGAAMIAPNMATMLAVIMTDAALEPDDTDAMLHHAVDDSFNCISVEGHTSTSDTVILMANGAASAGPLDDDAKQSVQSMVDEVCEELAQAIIRDAEGADHFIAIEVRGLKSRDDAHRIAKVVADSPLVKTAITGADPNWGRIVSAVGYSGVELRESDISLRISGTLLYASGSPVDYDEQAVSESIKASRDVLIELDFPLGDAGVRFWTSDLTSEYVRLNSEYTT